MVDQLTAGRLILLRHGESSFNAAQVFTGLLDAPLSPMGCAQVPQAGQLIQDAGLRPQVVVCSPLLRALQTVRPLITMLDLPEPKLTWRLCERDYGCLTGVSKAECRRRFGEQAFFQWRRTVDGKPPAASPEQMASWQQATTAELGPLRVGMSESLREVMARVEPFWNDLHGVLHHGDVLVVGHGNSLRALCALIDHLDDATVEQLNIPAGQPLVYDFDAHIRPLQHRYLDEESATTGAAAVAAEGGT